MEIVRGACSPDGGGLRRACQLARRRLLYRDVAWAQLFSSKEEIFMEKELFDYVAERVDILIASGSSTQVTKDAAQAWKDAVAADEGAADEATAKLADVLDGRPTTIDGVIAFAKGAAVDMFGEEKAAEILAAQLKRKEDGAKWCDCDACAAASEILAKFGRVEL